MTIKLGGRVGYCRFALGRCSPQEDDCYTICVCVCVCLCVVEFVISPYERCL